MRVDDFWTYVLANNASFMAALSTGDYPLVTLLDKHRIRDAMEQLGNNVAVYLDDQPEEIEEATPSYRIVTLEVDAYVIVRGAKEANLREIALRYAQGLASCASGYPYFFGVSGRQYFEGVDGNPDLKGSMVKLQFKYEEAV